MGEDSWLAAVGHRAPRFGQVAGDLAIGRSVPPVRYSASARGRDAIQQAVKADLTARQRDVFIAVVVLEVPVDVVAERHGSTRGAIYKVLHDARRNIRVALTAQGWDVGRTGEAT